MSIAMTFQKLKSGDRIRTRNSGMATVVETNCHKGTMVKLKCDAKKWSCPYFYEHELELMRAPIQTGICDAN